MVSARVSWHLSLRQVVFAAVLVAVAALILGASQLFIGPNTTTSGYLTILFLLAIVRSGSWRVRLLSASWALAVALLGYAVGGLGIGATLVALVVVSLMQGVVTVGEAALLTRSPVNLLAFASLAQSGAEVWQVLLGSVIGAGVVLGFSATVHARSASHIDSEAIRERLSYGIATAIGSIVIVVGGDLIGFPYVGWALLSFAIMLSFDSGEQTSRGYWRILGSALGAVLAVFFAALPTPIPTVAAVICLVVCVAYINAGNYALFMLFLTPTVLLTTASEYSPFTLGVYRLEAVLAATLLALVCGFALRALHRPARSADDGA